MPRRAAGPIERAVAEAMRTAELRPRDGATAALATRYAQLIDQAAPASKYAESLRTLAGAVGDDEAAARALQRVADALAEHSVASDLGPKLLAALERLGMTVSARAASGPPEGGGSVDPASAALGRLQLIAGGAGGPARVH